MEVSPGTGQGGKSKQAAIMLTQHPYLMADGESYRKMNIVLPHLAH